ncbi:MAG: zf-TFIIB domain-containing protein [Rhodoglobus sp.]|nr:zf-TFIIB domain-containing protein [Rhodoglobus sp.]
MKCPVDDSQLVMSERSGVEIDYCPQCRGVWLDRGELDKIVERSLTQPSGEFRGEGGERRSSDGHGGSGHGGYSTGRSRKKESWLGELFG